MAGRRRSQRNSAGEADVPPARTGDPGPQPVARRSYTERLALARPVSRLRSASPRQAKAADPPPRSRHEGQRGSDARSRSLARAEQAGGAARMSSTVQQQFRQSSHPGACAQRRRSTSVFAPSSIIPARAAPWRCRDWPQQGARKARLKQAWSIPRIIALIETKVCICRRPCQAMGMAQDVSVIVRDDDRARLEAIVGDTISARSTCSGRGLCCCRRTAPVAAVARQAGVSRPAVWRWQHRFAEQGVGLLRDKTHAAGNAAVPDETVARVVAMTCAEPPGEATHWTGRALAKEAGISLQFGAADLGRNADLQPHRLGPLSARTIQPSPRSCGTSSGCTLTRRLIAWCFRVDEKSESRRSTAPSPACTRSPVSRHLDATTSAATPPPCSPRSTSSTAG